MVSKDSIKVSNLSFKKKARGGERERGRRGREGERRRREREGRKSPPIPPLNESIWKGQLCKANIISLRGP
jgi:hypothetical protein